MVNFAFNLEGNIDLSEMNELNQQIYEHTSFVEGNTYINDLILLDTSFSQEDYGDVPLNILKMLVIEITKFKNKGSMNILRWCVLLPWLYDRETAKYFTEKFDNLIIEKLTKILNKN